MSACPPPKSPGWRPVNDIAGVVVRAAADGGSPAAGVRVAGYLPDGGGRAEYAAVATDRLSALSSEVDFAAAAAGTEVTERRLRGKAVFLVDDMSS
ncbi:hypothetical protein ORV05_02170 [Amycolatopsis cynarae]|uniref:Uncharacterized protein n=1 Tax=Amycolatopsis cynarae TaxID=2995223 RepID=A0ABY7B2W6_9PSEU|nr:hypothetical protein [Amycolatopsis sp. HUAS 11-8]WAL66645.1 hypothetical protein ORV05_02170 [Amycolatopsis sp. HUAS 11-8]